jgi:hypothetical protein
MAAYLNIVTKEYPRHDGDLELLGWEVGQPLPSDWVEVLEVELPETQDDEKLIIGFPVENNGKWYVNPIIEKMTEQEYSDAVAFRLAMRPSLT